MNSHDRMILHIDMDSFYASVKELDNPTLKGRCVMFSLGGIFAEFEKDVAFVLAPLGQEEATALIRRIRSRKLLEGFQGMSPLKESLVADILVRLGNLGTSCDQIDINPLTVSGGVPTAVDATVIMSRRDGSLV